MARTRTPPTVTSRAAGAERSLSLPPPLSRARPPRPCSIVPSAPSAVHFGFTRIRSGDYLQRLFGGGKRPLGPHPPEAAPPVSERPRDSFSARTPPLTLRLSRPDQNGPDPTPPRTALLAYSRPPRYPPHGRSTPVRAGSHESPAHECLATPTSRLRRKRLGRSIFSPYSFFFGPRGGQVPGTSFRL